MAPRKEAEEDPCSGYRLPNNGMDVLPNHGYEDHGAKDLGPI